MKQSHRTGGPEHAVVHASDGFPLAVRTYSPEKAARATVILHGATAVPQSYYARFASHLATEGARVVTFDYRGVGGSRPASLRGFSATMTDWATRDAVAVVRWAKARWGGPRIAIGHSFGGQALGLADEAYDVDGAVFVAAQLGFYGHWPARERARLGLMWYGLVPALTSTVGYLPAWGGLGEELPADVAREWAKWCRSPGYYLDHVPGSRARLASFDRPLLALSFDDDDFAPRRAVDALLDTLTRARVDHRHIRPSEVGLRTIGHFGFFRVRAAGLWSEVSGFMEDVIARASVAA